MILTLRMIMARSPLLVCHDHLCNNRAERGRRWWVRRGLRAQTGAWTSSQALLLLIIPPQHRLPLLLILLTLIPPGQDRIHTELQVGLVWRGGGGAEVPGKPDDRKCLWKSVLRKTLVGKWEERKAAQAESGQELQPSPCSAGQAAGRKSVANFHPYHH